MVQIDEPIPNINCRFISFHIHKGNPVNIVPFWFIFLTFFPHRITNCDLIFPEIARNCTRLTGLQPQDQPDSRDESSSVSMRFYFKAVKEKLVREKITLNCEDWELKIEMVARVLGKGKGTPMLRDGIKCVEVLQDLDTETEASDWQGFWIPESNYRLSIIDIDL